MPDEALLKEVDGTSTWDSLRATRRFLEERDADEVVLVTDDYHAYRVEAIAEEVGFDATVSPTDSLLSGTKQLRQLVRETAAVSVGRHHRLRPPVPHRPRPQRLTADRGVRPPRAVR